MRPRGAGWCSLPPWRGAKTVQVRQPARSRTLRSCQQADRVGYTRALCAHMPPLAGVDQVAELRKMRLLLESLL